MKDYEFICRSIWCSVKEYRDVYKITDGQVASILDIKISDLRCIDCGLFVPDLDACLKLATVFGLDVVIDIRSNLIITREYINRLKSEKNEYRKTLFDRSLDSHRTVMLQTYLSSKRRSRET